jgi:hypothetical protein
MELIIMANSLLTINMITREAIRLWKNSNAFLQNIDRQYDADFAKSGAKIGSSLRIRLPNDFTVRTGAAAAPQDTSEQSTSITVATQKGVDVQFSSAERSLSLDDYSKRILAPAINNLAGSVAADIIGGSEGIPNLSSKVDGSNNLLSPDASTWLSAGAVLDQVSAPRGDRKIILDPMTMARTVTSLAGLFNPAAGISKQYASGMMQQALGYDWMMDQTTIKHTTGAYSTLGTVAGANQTGSTITVSALAGPLAVGDVISFAGVNSVNRITKQDNGSLSQHVVLVAAAGGATSLSIYPPLTPPSGGNPVQYQTVTASPANGAAITVATKAGTTYRKNFVFLPQAATLVTADLELPRGVHEAAREMIDDTSMRMVTAYNVSTDQFITRLDILYGYKWVRPEWAVVVPDVL